MKRVFWFGRRAHVLSDFGEAHLAHLEHLGESSLLPVGAVLAAAGLYATLPAKFITGTGGVFSAARWVVPAIAAALIIPLALTAPKRRLVYSVRRRTLMLAVIAMLSIANTGSIVLLVKLIVDGNHVDGHQLIRAAIHIWCTSVLVFGLGYWQLDRGGPLARRSAERRHPDFLFPQMTNAEFAPPAWQPMFLDYVYVAFTNAIAFSPTDAMPLTRSAKTLMLVQSAGSLLLLAMVAARAVNILK
jgi:hypothetical protein